MPVLGMLPALFRDPVQVLDLAMRDHGDIVNLPVPGHRRLYALNHPELIRHVLYDNHSNYVRTPLQDKGLLNSDGATWRDQRRLLQPAFGLDRIRSDIDTMTRATEELADRWEETSRRGGAVPVATDMLALSMTIITRVLFGRTPEREAQISAGVAAALDHAAHRFRAPFLPGDRLPTPRRLKVQFARSRLNRIIAAVIAERGSGSGSPEGDLLDRLLSARNPDTGEPMPRSLVRDEVVTILLAGVEATAAALTWTCYLLSQYPATADHLHAEVGVVLGDRPPVPEDLDRMPLTRMVVQEVLRLYPPVPWFGRVALERDRIADYDVPAGTTILFSPYVMQRHPLYWDHPERFIPERFLPAKVSRRPSYLYFPFGGGPRTCLGNHFALTEMQVVTAMLARRFRLHLVPETKVEHRIGVTMRPTGPLPMHAERRIGIVRP